MREGSGSLIRRTIYAGRHAPDPEAGWTYPQPGHWSYRLAPRGLGKLPVALIVLGNPRALVRPVSVPHDVEQIPEDLRYVGYVAVAQAEHVLTCTGHVDGRC